MHVTDRGPPGAEASIEVLQRVRPAGAYPPTAADHPSLWFVWFGGLPHTSSGRNNPKQVRAANRVMRRIDYFTSIQGAGCLTSADGSMTTAANTRVRKV